MTLTEARLARRHPDSFSTFDEFAPMIAELVDDMHAQNILAGWGDWTEEDIWRNSGKLFDIVRQKLICNNCPGENRCPRRYAVYTRCLPQESPSGRRVAKVAVGRCHKRRCLPAPVGFEAL